MLETGQYVKLAGRGNKKADMDKYTNKAEVRVYNSAADSTLPSKKVGVCYLSRTWIQYVTHVAINAVRLMRF